MAAPAQTVHSPLATINEAAQFLRVSRSKIYLMLETGDLPSVRFGTARRVRWADLERLVQVPDRNS